MGNEEKQSDMALAGAPTRTAHGTILLAWIIVLIPLGWGVYQSVVNSLPLFDMNAR
jgi:hypothetical protein